VLRRFGFQFSTAQLNPLAIDHSLTGPFPDEPFEPSGPYPELVGCLMYLMTCTRPDLAFPLSILARFVAPGRHRPVQWIAAVRVAKYLATASGVGLVFGGRQPAVLTSHCDSSYANDVETHRSTQGYCFSLGSGDVLWRSNRSSSVSTSTAEADVYARAMAAQELRWLTFLLTNLGEQPSSAPTLFTHNKAMILLCREPRLESRVKHSSVRYFLLRELQRRGHARLDFMGSEANAVDIFIKALPPCYGGVSNVVACSAACYVGLRIQLNSRSTAFSLLKDYSYREVIFRTPAVPPERRPAPQPARRPALQPARRHALQLARRPALQPVHRPALQLARHPALQLARCSALQPVRRPALQPARRPALRPARRPALRPARRPALQLVRCPALQPTLRPALQPVRSPALQPVRSPALQPVEAILVVEVMVLEVLDISGSSVIDVSLVVQSLLVYVPFEPGGTGAASVEALHTFTLDSGATRYFFRDYTTVTPLTAPVPVSLAEPSGGPVIARASTVLPCLAAPSRSLIGFHLPSFSKNLVSNAVLQDQFVTVTNPGDELVAISCTDLPLACLRCPRPACLAARVPYCPHTLLASTATLAIAFAIAAIVPTATTTAAATSVATDALAPLLLTAFACHGHYHSRSSVWGRTAAAAGQQRQSRHQETLSPQQLREWVIQRGHPGGGGYGAGGATRYFFRDYTTVTPLTAPVPVSLAEPSGGPVIARASTVLPCLAAPSRSLIGFHLPSFSKNLVSNAVLQDQFVTVTNPGDELVAICTDSHTGEHLVTFTRSPGSGLYTLTTESAQAVASGQLAG
ncbi:unnamed protein product, partial [Closterium sp. NIES-54]